MLSKLKNAVLAAASPLKGFGHKMVAFWDWQTNKAVRLWRKLVPEVNPGSAVGAIWGLWLGSVLGTFAIGLYLTLMLGTVLPLILPPVLILAGPVFFWAIMMAMNPIPVSAILLATLVFVSGTEIVFQRRVVDYEFAAARADQDGDDYHRVEVQPVAL